MGPRKPPQIKDLCLYLIELDDNASTGAPDDTLELLRHCIQDKIFSENSDHIAICRSDMTSNVEFFQATWDALRSVERTFYDTKLSEPGKERNCISTLLDLCEIMIVQAGEDSYEAKKILFFGHLKSQKIDKKAALRLAKMLKNNRISMSMILTDEEIMDDEQKKNLEVINEVFGMDEYADWGFVTSCKKAKRQIMNTSSKRATKLTSWNTPMEIGPNITINVCGYVCTRKNTVGEMTKALMKSVPEPQQGVVQTIQAASSSSAAEKQLAQKAIVVEVAKNVTEKAIVWKEKDGTVVDEADVGKGFLYGDKIIPFNELESENAYDSGGKCLKLLVFCPASNILPAYHIGDGTTLFYPKKGATADEMKFDALLKALNNSERVAIVRKVYRKGTRVNLGVMSPDMVRMCLVYSEICFADDISVPHFATLIKDVTEHEGITKQELLMDKLIGSMTIDEFYPGDGPVDPAVSRLRNNIACKILGQLRGEKKPSGSAIQGIDIFFDEMVMKDELLANLRESFPLKIKQEESERPAGANIFRKRIREDDQKVGLEDEKKIKIEESDSIGYVDKESGVGTLDENAVDMDDLLDQL